VSEPSELEGSEELFALLDRLPHRISGFLLDGGRFSYDKRNKLWIIQKKERGKVIKMSVPHEYDDIVKQIRELMTDVTAADLVHMESIRKKIRDTRQPILMEEIDTASWSVRVPFMLGKMMYMRALQHVTLSSEERSDANLAVEKFVQYYENLLSQDLRRPTPDQVQRRTEMKREAERAAQQAGYEVLSKTPVVYMLVTYKCPNVPPMHHGFKTGLPKDVGSVLILQSKLDKNKNLMEEFIRRDISLRMDSVF